MGCGEGGVFLPQNVARQALPEAVFDIRPRQHLQPADDGGKADLRDRRCDDRHGIVPECSAAVHDVPQEKDTENAQPAAHALKQRQSRQTAFLSSCDPPAPAHCEIYPTPLSRKKATGQK